MTFQPVGQVATKIVDRWRWWQTALADPTKIGTPGLPIHESEPQQGYFRVRKKDGPWEPVALFYPEESDTIVAYRNGQSVAAVEALWIWCCRQPITVEAYDKAIAGGGWDDEPERAPGIGDNSADADPRESLWLEFLGEKETAEQFLKAGIKTQADADRASIWKDRILKIKSRATALFKAEKQPSIDEGRRIDDRWRALAHDRDSDTAAMVDRLRIGMEAFLKAQKRAEEERQRKASEEAETARRVAAEAERKAREAGDAEQETARRDAERLAEQARQAERDAEARKVNAGRTGARTSIRVEKKGEIVDYDKFVMAVRDRDEVKDLMQSLANRAAKSGFKVDGMKIVDVEKVV